MFEVIGLHWWVALSVILLLYAFFWYYIHGYRRYVKSNVSLKGKTVVITGGNSGIGKETAVDLARRGALVILACRNTHKAEEAALDVRRLSGNNDVICRCLDLSSLESVRQFVKKFKKEKHRLDILINNAGIVRAPGQTTNEGFDMVFGVNHFGHFLLTNLLVDKLKECAPSRVITVASGAAKFAKSIDFTSKERNGVRYPGLSTYGKSKAANIMFARELARRLEGTGVTSFSLRPGVTYTNIFASHHARLEWFFRPLIWLLTTSQTTGAQCTIYCAVDESITHFSGRFFDNCQLNQIRSPIVLDDGLTKKLWEVSCQAVGVEEDVLDLPNLVDSKL